MILDKERIFGVVIFILGLVFLGILLNFGLSDFSIWFIGEDVYAEITDTSYVMTNPGDVGDPNFEYFVQYKFMADNGEIIVGESSMSANEWSGARVGGELLVNYSRMNPENNRIDDSRYRSLFICSYLPFAIICLFALINGWKMMDVRFSKKNSDE